jgi:small-conductance mechanosensitive channel
MREILEWHAALKTAVERGYPLADAWIEDFHRQVQSRLKQTEAAASTDMDLKTVPLLTNEFNNMRALTDEYLKMKTDRDYIAPDFLSKDPLEQKLLACWQSLASMASSHQFVDDGACQ